jgi:hypothetical protein
VPGGAAFPLLLLLAGCASSQADGLAGRYLDPDFPYGGRVEALEKLRTSPPEERERVFPSLAETLRAESARADGLYLSDLEERAVAAAFAWLAEARDASIATRLELHLDRATARRKRLPDRVLAAAALGLGRFPERESGREVLWAALLDPAERPAIRAASMKALQAHHPADLEGRIRKAPAAGDPWLADLQRTLR